MRFLEQTLLFTIIAHGLGMIFMLIFLFPGIPGGTQSDPLLRITYYAEHPWLWRLGWLPWQITALSDLLLSIALLRISSIPRLPAILGLIFTIAAIIPDQVGQFVWTWSYHDLARQAIEDGTVEAYLAKESQLFMHIAGSGPLGYLLAALCWTWSFIKLGTWQRWLSWISLITWSLFAFSIALVFFPKTLGQNPFVSIIVAAANGLAFLFLMIWFYGVYLRLRSKQRQL